MLSAQAQWSCYYNSLRLHAALLKDIDLERAPSTRLRAFGVLHVAHGNLSNSYPVWNGKVPVDPDVAR